MKFMNKILASTAILICFASCEDFLTVEPEFKFVEDLAIGSLDGLEKTTTGAFNQLQSENLYGGGMTANSELLADHIQTEPVSDFSLSQLASRNMNAFNGQAGGMWNDAYRAINIANVVLENLPNFIGEDDELSELIEAECLFIRGILHWELVRMFAQPAGFTSDNSHPGIPLRLSVGNADAGQNTPRSSVAEVYDQVIEDLTAAEAILPANKNKRASAWAARAFLAKVHFQLKAYDEALRWAEMITTNSVFQLDSNVTVPFGLTGDQNHPEVIWQIINLPDDKTNGLIIGRFRFTVLGQPLYRMSELFAETLEVDSILSGMRSDDLYINTEGARFCKKYNNINMNIPVIRLPEMLLIVAEAKAELGAPDQEVRDAYNPIRQRANLPTDNSSTGQQALLNAIWFERGLELAFEGDRFHDLKRRQKDFVTQAGTFSWNANNLVYPIPQAEVDNNPNMQQNPGY